MDTAVLPNNGCRINELDFTEINLDEGNEREKFMKKYPYLRTSPQIFCDGENIGGFTELLKKILMI